MTKLNVKLDLRPLLRKNCVGFRVSKAYTKISKQLIKN